MRRASSAIVIRIRVGTGAQARWRDTTMRIHSAVPSTLGRLGWPGYVDSTELDRLGVSIDLIDAMLLGDESERVVGHGMLVANPLAVVAYFKKQEVSHVN